jgi:hypothetical protein
MRGDVLGGALELIAALDRTRARDRNEAAIAKANAFDFDDAGFSMGFCDELVHLPLLLVLCGFENKKPPRLGRLSKIYRDLGKSALTSPAYLRKGPPPRANGDLHCGNTSTPLGWMSNRDGY